MEVSCPISVERVNENVIRVIALLVITMALSSIFYLGIYAVLFLVIDFATRAFTSGKFSLLKFFALNIAKGLKLPNKVTNLAPKKFAATLGFVFCLLISLCYLLMWHELSIGFTIVLIALASLESFFAICVGCHVYSIWQRFFGSYNR